ncbi:hypothetical protein D3C72_1180710 [compost metagenome]
MRKNTDCQPKAASESPPIVGPMAGPTASMMPMRFMMLEASAPVNWSRTTARATVMPTEAPMPWISRAKSSTSIVGAKMASNPPPRKMDRKTRLALRRPKASEAGPASSCAIAKPAK